MNTSFWVIFLCLVIGAVIGYEFGKYTVSKRIRGVLNDAANDLKVAAENLKKKQEQEKSHTNPLASLGLIGFNSKYYKVKDDQDIPEGFDKKKELDEVSNLIATMTYKGAMDSEIGRAVRYSMVVIDTEKERLNWKQAKADEGIDILKDKYMKETHCYGEGV